MIDCCCIDFELEEQCEAFDWDLQEIAVVGDKFFQYAQLSPSARWEISHPLAKYPSVTVVDSGGSVVIGEVEYIDDANIVITFQAAFAGKAYLN